MYCIPGVRWKRRSLERFRREGHNCLRQSCATLVRMNANELVTAIDSEIATLQQVRALLTGQGGTGSHRADSPRKRRSLSADARARIAAAQRRRWAKQKRTAKAA